MTKYIVHNIRHLHIPEVYIVLGNATLFQSVIIAEFNSSTDFLQ
jgi:hypothetical protein